MAKPDLVFGNGNNVDVMLAMAMAASTWLPSYTYTGGRDMTAADPQRRTAPDVVAVGDGQVGVPLWAMATQFLAERGRHVTAIAPLSGCRRLKPRRQTLGPDYQQQWADNLIPAR